MSNSLSDYTLMLVLLVVTGMCLVSACPVLEESARRDQNAVQPA